MSDYFRDKVAIVTGAASPRGLGRAISNRIAKEGSKIVIIDIKKEDVEKAAIEIENTYKVETIGIACNVTDSKDCDRVSSIVKERFGRLDFLVNNAGVLRDNLLMRMSEDDWDLVMDVNLKGVFLMTKALSKLILKSTSGRIVNISSVSGLSGQPAQANYSSSKAGVIALTKVTAREFAGRGVTVNAVCPGFISTDMTKSLPEDIQKKLTEMIPLKKLATPEDIAGTVKFFLSEDAAYITGTYLRVDGGAAIGM
jgi:3-oxoacyl-[acyl-carrier protein] reductase